MDCVFFTLARKELKDLRDQKCEVAAVENHNHHHGHQKGPHYRHQGHQDQDYNHLQNNPGSKWQIVSDTGYQDHQDYQDHNQ